MVKSWATERDRLNTICEVICDQLIQVCKQKKGQKYKWDDELLNSSFQIALNRYRRTRADRTHRAHTAWVALVLFGNLGRRITTHSSTHPDGKLGCHWSKCPMYGHPNPTRGFVMTCICETAFYCGELCYQRLVGSSHPGVLLLTGSASAPRDWDEGHKDVCFKGRRRRGA